MNLINLVYDSLKWKKSDEFCAAKLDITLEKYRNVKDQIRLVKEIFQDDLDDVLKDLIQKKIQEQEDERTLIEESVRTLQERGVVLNKEPKVIESKHNLDDGTAELKAISFTEPKSAEEIEKILKIDKSKWKLATYWNKEHKGYWLVSAMVTQKKPEPVDILRTALEDLQLKYTPITENHINKKFTDNTCAVLSLQDIHVGKEVIEHGGSIEASVKACIQQLIYKSYHSFCLDKIIFVLGGDLVNMDTWLGTTTSGTPVANSMGAYEAFQLAFELMFWSVNFLKQFCNELEVVYIPGNHSRLTEAHIAYALSRQITDPHITWNIGYATRKAIQYGNSMICLEHGDFDTRKSFAAFATEFPEMWGKTKYRVVYTGHYHKEKKIEYLTTDELNGLTVKVLPSLCRKDRYHDDHKWFGNKRGGIIELHNETKGPVGQFSYYE
jgi:hypothetical protein